MIIVDSQVNIIVSLKCLHVSQEELAHAQIVTPWSLYFVFSLLFWSGQGVTCLFMWCVLSCGFRRYWDCGLVGFSSKVYGCLNWFSIR